MVPAAILLPLSLQPAISAAAPWIGTLSVATLPLAALAVAVAVLRYRLYDIDRIRSRTIGWAIVSLILAGTFVGVIVGLQTILAPVTDENTLAVAASTLLAAALFQPLRTRVQRAVDRRFNRSRVDAQRAIDAFGVQLRDEIDLGSLQHHLVVDDRGDRQPYRRSAVDPRGRAMTVHLALVTVVAVVSIVLPLVVVVLDPVHGVAWRRVLPRFRPGAGRLRRRRLAPRGAPARERHRTAEPDVRVHLRRVLPDRPSPEARVDINAAGRSPPRSRRRATRQGSSSWR